ncbi:tRNA lysidine(34) synthetase TilS [Aquitalea sp.]|uniref:tRNA lysidine(34) synthetase TilS n=1 Tax=Aquitalea sp. TaxID=1872623 RepID=UPI00258FC788|nr:tRNA lysidine(34) synthetase TilS [Aquitalea sp.]
MQPDLLPSLLASWPDNLSGLSAFEVGLSGGLDSMVLLSLLVRARRQRPQLQISAVHVHHGLSDVADEWVGHCQAVCAEWGVPLRVVRVQVDRAAPEGVEANARKLRYAAYAQSTAAVLALAHHQDDQSETVLLQLLRGGSVKALAGMPVCRPLAALHLWRPLLSYSRQQLEQYAAAHQLRWVEDDSNADTRYRRNMLRHCVMPLLAQQLPDYRQHIARTAWHMGQASALIDEVVAADLAQGSRGHGFDVASLLALSEVRQGFVLLAWLRQQGVTTVSAERVQEFLRQLRDADAASQPSLVVGGLAVLRHRGELHVLLLRDCKCLPDVVQAFSGESAEQVFPDWGGRLCWSRRGGIAADVLAQGIRLSPRRGGERLPQPVGRKQVKKLLQEAGIPPLLRQQWPLLFGMDGRLLALPGVAVSSDCYDAAGYWPEWLPE